MGLDIVEHQLHQHLKGLDMDDFLERQDEIKLDNLKDELKDWLVNNTPERGFFIVHVEGDWIDEFSDSMLERERQDLTEEEGAVYAFDKTKNNYFAKLTAGNIYSLVIDQGFHFDTLDGNTFDKGIL